jgi:HK97 family phage major capsid protein
VSTVTSGGYLFNTLREARTALELDNVEARDLVLNPNDVESLDLTQDDVAQFYYGGPLTANADGSSVWSARIISSPAIAEGTAIMGDLRRAVSVFQRGQVQLAVDPCTGFKVNEVDLRAEGRFAVGITAPYALRIVELV